METSSGAWKEKKEGMKKKGPGGALYAKWVAPGRVARLLTESRQGMWRDSGSTSATPDRARPTWRLSRARACDATEWVVAPRGLTRPKGLLFAILVGPGLFLINYIKKLKNKKFQHFLPLQRTDIVPS
jgi:hypothetical protein